jgi:hypothetical protein
MFVGMTPRIGKAGRVVLPNRYAAGSAYAKAAVRRAPALFGVLSQLGLAFGFSVFDLIDDVAEQTGGEMVYSASVGTSDSCSSCESGD